MSTFLKALHQRPIAYYPLYRLITGSTTGAILLSQLMYWFSKKRKFYKTNQDIMEETALSDKELEGAKRKLKELPFIRVKREGLPAKTYYTIDWSVYETHIRRTLGAPSSPKRGELDTLKGGNNGSPRPPFRGDSGPYTKNTQVACGQPTIKNHPRWKKYATRLTEAISHGRKRRPGPVRGADEFRKLHTVDGTPIAKIREVLEWYCEQARGTDYLKLGAERFIPVCGNGFSFRKKFEGLEAAMAREDLKEGIDRSTKGKIKEKVNKTIKKRRSQELGW